LASGDCEQFARPPTWPICGRAEEQIANQVSIPLPILMPERLDTSDQQKLNLRDTAWIFRRGDGGVGRSKSLKFACVHWFLVAGVPI